MSILSKAVARINISGFVSFEARTWQLFICKRCVSYKKNTAQTAHLVFANAKTQP